MTLKQVLIAPQADGTTATTGNTGAASITMNGGSTCVWQSSMIRITGATAQTCQLRYAANGSNNNMQYTFHYKTPASWPFANVAFFNWRNTTPARAGSIGITNAGVLYVNDFANSITVALNAGILALNTEYVFKLDVFGGSTTASRIKIRVETTAGVLVGTEYDSGTNRNFSAVTLNNFDLSSTLPASTAMVLDFSKLQVNDGTSAGYIADYVSSTPLADPDVTVTGQTNPTTVGGSDGSISISWPAVPNATSYKAAILDGSVTTGFDAVAVTATSPWSFTGLDASPGPYTIAVKAIA